MGKMFGYARVSSVEQNLDSQIAALEEAGCSLVRSEKLTGTKLDGRDELDLLMKIADAGDVICITRLDRLARSLRDLHTICARLDEMGAGLKVLEQPIDTTTAEGRLFFNMLGAFAEFETDLRRARQRDGIEAAKRRGAYKGRPPKIDNAAILAAYEAGAKVPELVASFGVSRRSIYRAISPDDKRVPAS
jgi:DNA invertase Pin-like site-specific DNA recombinase